MRRLRRLRPSPAMVVACMALAVALGGTSYAAFELPKNSVGTKQLKKGAVTKKKIAKKTIAALKGRTGPQGPQGPQGSKGDKGDTGDQGPPGPSTGPAGGDLAGNYPNPSIAPGAVGASKLGALPAVRATVPEDFDVTANPDGGYDCGHFAQYITDSTENPLNFRAEDFDNSDMHNTFTPPAHTDNQADCFPTQNLSRLTAPRAGLYQVSAGVIWGTFCSAGTRQLNLKKNGTQYLAAQQTPPSPIGNATIQNVSALTALNQGDYVQAIAWQNCGSGLFLYPGTSDGRGFAAMDWVGP